jgi:hypothetical protein
MASKMVREEAMMPWLAPAMMRSRTQKQQQQPSCMMRRRRPPPPSAQLLLLQHQSCSCLPSLSMQNACRAAISHPFFFSIRRTFVTPLASSIATLLRFASLLLTYPPSSVKALHSKNQSVRAMCHRVIGWNHKSGDVETGFGRDVPDRI